MGTSEVTMNELTEKIIGACIEVHRALGPGLLESAYEQCLCHELYWPRWNWSFSSTE